MHRFHSEYRFDLAKQSQQRITWIHLSGAGTDTKHSEGEFDEALSLPPYSQNEISVSPGDIIEFTVCLANMNGIVNLESLAWEQAILIDINPNEKDPLTYNRDLKIIQMKGDRKVKVHCNTNRLCEVEDAVVDWINVSHIDQPKIQITLKNFMSPIQQSFFKVLSTQYNELDLHFSKMVLQTTRKGIVPFRQSSQYSLIIEILESASPITNEIKRRGVIFDRNKPSSDGERIQLRVGDILVVYNTRSIPREFQPEIVYAMSEYASRTSGD